jgi:tol-pal system protein YbgF
MTMLSNNLRKAAVAACMLFAAGNASAQDRGLLEGLFSRGEPARGQQADITAEQAVRINQLENQIRQLTGTIEQLQFRNQQLEQELARAGGGVPVAAPPAVSRPMPGAAAAPIGSPQAAAPIAQSPSTSGRRSDVFDPTQNPNAVGAPRALGGGNQPIPASSPPPVFQTDAPVGAQSVRAPGAPLDLAAAGTPVIPSNVPNTAPREPAGQQVAALPPSAAPKDEYDLGVGYMQRKDYALAETTFRSFLKKNAGNTLAPDAHYQLGESLYQRKRYQDAADSYLVVVRNYDSSAKAPEALLRLGQSLAALGQKEMACASLNEVSRKYPRASASVKSQVAQEQKRGSC